MNELLQKISVTGLIPVVKIEDATLAAPLMAALKKAGLFCAEITFRTAAAEDAIKNIKKAFPDILLGAGTVLSKEQVDCAMAAGASFIISPGFNPEVVKYCVDNHILIIPGASTASEMEQALSMGINTIKFFPAELNGGLKAIKSYVGPYKNLRFMPTGGINADNLNDYLSFPSVIACGGSWIADPGLIAKQDFEAITAIASQAVGKMLGLQLSSIEFSIDDEGDKIRKINELLQDCFDFSAASQTAPACASLAARARSSQAAISLQVSTNYIDRAINYLKLKNWRFKEATARYDTKGGLLSMEIDGGSDGFTLILIQK